MEKKKLIEQRTLHKGENQVMEEEMRGGKKEMERFLTRQEKEERRRKGEGRINHEYVKKGGKLRQRERQREKKKLEGTSNCNKNTHTKDI